MVAHPEATAFAEWPFILAPTAEELPPILAGNNTGMIVPASALGNPEPARGVVAAVHVWVADVVARADPRLRRAGPQCPFVPPAFKFDSLYYAPVGGCRGTRDVEAAIDSLMCPFWELNRMHSGHEQFVALVAIFTDIAPEVATELVIEPHHRRLKSALVAAGAMLGEFAPTHFLPAKNNADFNVGWAPAPVLAIRNMVPSDDRFLKGDPAWEAAYASRFGTPAAANPKSLVDRFAPDSTGGGS